MQELQFFRKDQLYVHPTTAQTIINKRNYSFSEPMTKEIIPINLKLSYFYGKILSIQQSPPIPLFYKLKNKENSSWQTISFDFIFFPTLFTIEAIEMPARMDDIQTLLPSHTYPEILALYSYDSWLTAELLYINCSERYSFLFTLAFGSHVPFKKICQRSNQSLTPIQSFQVLFPFKAIFKGNMNEQILEINFHQKQIMSRQRMGEIVVQSTASDVFCIGFYKHCFLRNTFCVKFGATCEETKNIESCENTQIRKRYNVCHAVYKTHSAIHSHHLSTTESFRIRFLTYRWPHVVLKLFHSLTNASENVKVKSTDRIEYKWKELTGQPESINSKNYKLYFVHRTQTWFASHRMCHTKNMTLPSFSCVHHLQNTLSLLNKHYSIPLSGMFIALAKKVRALCLWIFGTNLDCYWFRDIV